MNFLLIAKFEVNLTKSSFTKMIFFLIMKKYIPRFDIKFITFWDFNATQRAKREIVVINNFVKKIE